MAAEGEETEQIFQTPDLSDLDPSTQGGFRLVYARECPLEMRLQTSDEAPQEIGTLEAILCKVLVCGDPSAPTMVKVELSSESDLFFHYTHIAEERTWKAMRDEQRLMVSFQVWPISCMSLLLPNFLPLSTTG
jgi:hypothetical protein